MRWDLATIVSVDEVFEVREIRPVREIWSEVVIGQSPQREELG